MQDKDRHAFDSALNTMTRMIGSEPYPEEIKAHYFKYLKFWSIRQFLKATEYLANYYKPKRQGDYPVLADFHQAPYEMTKTAVVKASEWTCSCVGCGLKVKAGAEDEIRAHGCETVLCHRCGKCHNHCRCELGPQNLEDNQDWQKLKALLFNDRELAEQRKPKREPLSISALLPFELEKKVLTVRPRKKYKTNF